MIRRSENRLEISGAVTMETVTVLFNEGLKAETSSNMLIDLSNLEKVDSSAVSLMLAWLREAQKNKVSIKFVSVPDNLMSLAKLYGVAELLSLNSAE